MPAIITIPLTTSTPLFFDETWPLERLFHQTLDQSQSLSAGPRNDQVKAYTLSSIWRMKGRGLPVSGSIKTMTYLWRVCLLDDTLTSRFLEGLEVAKTLSLNGQSLTVGQAALEEWTYERLAQQAQTRAEARPTALCYIDLEFMTPVILRRLGLPLPLPDPVLIFHHYLHCWDTFAPRELWFNINILDGVEAHLALIEHQLETRQVKPDGQRVKTGFLGQATYKMMDWQKLGVEFLGTLHTLARFGEFCGTGELTTHGLGQTRYLRRGRKRYKGGSVKP
jgi:CRISPR/Cas system endoribonuclease Cas6 (RAMP superfamily)